MDTPLHNDKSDRSRNGRGNSYTESWEQNHSVLIGETGGPELG